MLFRVAERVDHATVTARACSVVVLHTGNEIQQLVHVAIHQRKVVDLHVIDRPAQDRVTGVKQRNIGRYLDCLRRPSGLQRQIQMGILIVMAYVVIRVLDLVKNSFSLNLAQTSKA